MSATVCSSVAKGSSDATRTPGPDTSGNYGRAMTAPDPLSTLLSQALVAHTAELDNEAEHRMAHWTTR